MTFRRSLGAFALLAATVPCVAVAHHSFSAFDRSESAKRTVQGTVKAFELINPHGWLKLVVAEPGGGTALWSFELSSATQLQKQGWTPTSVQPGEKLAITYFPLRFGSYGGQLYAVQFANGRRLVGTAEPDRGYPKPAGGV